MTKFFIYFIGLTIVVMTGCRTDKSLSDKAVIKPENIVLLAWNEDTIHDYRFTLTRDKKFAYKIIMRDTTKVERNYHGTFKNNSTYDTIFLTYYNNVRPLKANNYLVKEASGGYLIQSFEDNSKRIFLRIQRFGLNNFR